MLANIVDIDFHAMRVSLNYPHGALLLFDFKSDFSSISHDYLWASLAAIGIPVRWIDAIKLFYQGNAHAVKVGGKLYPSFTATSGVRQGCPLSPLLFAAVVDVLLRRLSSSFSDSIVRAFADDTAMVVPHFHAVALGIHNMFDEFGKISGLVLNIPKTVIIPLWPSSPSSVKNMLRDMFAPWKDVQVTYAAKYLGFMVGPQAGPKQWSGAINKFRSRCQAWRQLHLGLQYDARIYRVFCFSVLSFIWQLQGVDKSVLDAENEALRIFAPGPGNWATTEDLFQLSNWFGFPYAFPSSQLTSLAAKLRVIECEPIDGFD